MKPNLTGSSPFSPDVLELGGLGLSGLDKHLDHCKQSGGRFFVVRCGAEAMKSFMKTRLVTCAVAVVLIIGISSLAV
jgi:hypothetical protein